ncbi:MAG: tetratricopeptide repeat protein [Armatimonadetes bacterium]|nr:tetratricopeptide repeat protein [Armatimonadota bacterium]
MYSFSKTLLVVAVAAALVVPAAAQNKPEVSEQVQKAVVAAVNLYHEGKVDESLAKLEGLYKQDPRNVDVVNWLGYLYLQTGAPEKAVPMLVQAVGLQPENLPIRHDLAVAYMQSGRTGEAVAEFEELVSRSPENAEYQATLGSLYLQTNRAAKAVPVLTRALELSPGDGAVMTNLATALVSTNQEQKAVSAYEKILAEDPDNDVALSWLGYLYVQSGQAAKAVPILERARNLRANDLEILNNLGNAYVETGDEDKALGVYQAVTRLNPNLYQAWYNIGSIQLQRGNYAQAVEAFKECIERNRDDAFAHNNLGRAYEELKKPVSAAISYRRAADLEPMNKTFSRNAGLALVRDRQEMLAATYMERAIMQGVDEPEFRLVLAEVYSRVGRDSDALRMLENLTDSMSDSGPYWFNLGVLREGADDDAGAERAYRMSLEIEPADLDAMNNLGLLLFNSGRYDEAVGHFQKLAGTNTRSADAKLNLAAVYAKLGRKDESIQLWKSFLHVHPDRHDVRIDLANALWQKNETESARFGYQYVLNRSPKNAAALNGIGLYSLSKSNSTKAEAAFRRAIEADKAYMPAYNNLAVTLERRNKVAEAVAVLEQALMISPGFEDARKNLDRLKASGG